MVGDFLRSNKFLWGFSLKSDGNEEYDISKFTQDSVRKIIDHCLDQDIEVHFMPKEPIPFVMIKNPKSRWYYLTSEYDAGSFRNNILIEGNYELCQVV